MKDVLLRTRKESNILYLRARDYYFRKAKKYNQWRSFFAFLPTALTILMYLILSILSYKNTPTEFPIILFIQELITEYSDLLLGGCTIICFFAVKLFENKSDNYKEKSNIQREMYDNLVFELKPNLFSYDYQEVEKDKEAGKKYPEDYNGWKYEYWYDETFSDDINRNILCMQMDNALYSYHVFTVCKERYILQFVSLIALLISLLLFSFYLIGWKMCFLVFFAMFELISGKWEDIQTAEQIINRNKDLIEIVSDPNNIDVILKDLSYHIYCIEQCMIENRKKGLFLPKKVRNTYIDYYDELNDIRNAYLDDETTAFPESNSEIEIFTLDESKTNTLDQLQRRLNTILTDVVSVLSDAGIPYYLDRGSLLGSVRPVKNGGNTCTEQNAPDILEGGFLFWDDMIHITISREYEKAAKTLIKERFSQIYIVQDISAEELMSFPRYAFRVRERNEASQIHTKELLSPLFDERGVYITINTIGPIVVAPSVDRVIRKALFMGLVRKMERFRRGIYDKYLSNDSSMLNKKRERYSKYTTKYQKRLSLYSRIAKNQKWLSYTPGNINQYERWEIEKLLREKILKPRQAKGSTKKNKRRMITIRRQKTEPYFLQMMIWGSERTAKFEGNTYNIPYNYEEYLEAIYGEHWRISPFSTKEALKKKLGNSWYSAANRFHVSSLKNTRYVDL